MIVACAAEALEVLGGVLYEVAFNEGCGVGKCDNIKGDDVVKGLYHRAFAGMNFNM